MNKTSSMIEITVSGEGMTALESALRLTEGIVFNECSQSTRPKLLDRALKTESAIIAAAALAFCARILPKAIDAAKEIVVENLRSMKTTVKIKHSDGSEISFTGPIKDENTLNQLTDALTKRNTPKM